MGVLIHRNRSLDVKTLKAWGKAKDANATDIRKACLNAPAERG